MARHCMRPGCDRLAAARLTYDTEAAAVWLDRPAPEAEPAQQVCSIHAATLTAPLGWTVTDRRLMAVGPAGDPEHRSRSERDPVPRSTIRENGIGTTRAPVEVASAMPEPEPESVGGQRAPSAEPIAATLEAPQRSPEGAARADRPTAAKESTAKGAASRKDRPSLLDRAFEWTGPQHSVLTTERTLAPERTDPELTHPAEADHRD